MIACLLMIQHSRPGKGRSAKTSMEVLMTLLKQHCNQAPQGMNALM